MALAAMSWLLLLLAMDLAGNAHQQAGRPRNRGAVMKRVSLADCPDPRGPVSVNNQFGAHADYITPKCDQYKLPGCPRDFSPVCGSDMSTYPNECTLCMKIREDGHDIKIIRDGPC
uniref:Serine protease inhibitor Kazal-type 1 n=1 Tax=Molossus molossus TaxID=27622 RepID=A0A7J8K164_MOLMO|nr:serine peptidase inhibitor Kazal type 2 [Molossus molossus]